jgi:hypothetical protein
MYLRLNSLPSRQAEGCMTLQVSIRNVYGRDVVYPVCETSKLFAELARQKTLTDRELSILKKLGYTFEVVPQTL